MWGYEKGSGKTICSQPWPLHGHRENGFWTHCRQLDVACKTKTVIFFLLFKKRKKREENCSAEETNLCLQQLPPLSFPPYQYALRIPISLWLLPNHILILIMSGRTWSQPTFPLLLPSWGTCRATKSETGFRNTDEIHGNINAATYISESNTCSHTNAHLKGTGKYFRRLLW